MDMESPLLEKMCMVNTHDHTTPCLEDDEYVSHMEPPTSTTPTSKECDYKDNNIGVCDAMIPLVDMINCEYLHVMDDSIDITYAKFPFPCDALHETNAEYVESLHP
jgi:hypothetical protein